MSGGIGAITRAVMHPCAFGGPELWVRCAYPAALKAIVSLLPFDAKHITHALAGQSWIKSAKYLLEDAEVVDAFIDQDALNFLFKFAAFADTAAWWMFLADVLIDFAANWSTMVWEQSGCIKHPNSGYQYANDPFGAMSDGGVWSPLGAWHFRHPDPGSIGGPVFILPPFSTGSCGIAVTPSPIFGGNVPYKTRVRDATANHIIAESGWAGSDTFGMNSAICEGPFKTGADTHTLVGEYLMPTVNDGHAHVVGFNGGVWSASYKTDGGQ